MNFNRRSFLTTSSGAFLFSILPLNKIFSQTKDVSHGFITNEKDEDVFIFSNGLSKATLCIDKTKNKVDDVSLCKWEMNANDAVPIHRHMIETEIIFIEDGSCTFTIDDKTYQAQKGDAIYIPKQTWHGFTTGANETVKQIMCYTPSGFEGFFRETGMPVGATNWQPKTGPEMGAIAAKYHAEVRR